MDKQIRIQQVGKIPLKMKQKLALNDCRGEVLSLQYDHDDKFIGAACGDGTIKVFNAYSGKLQQSMQTPLVAATSSAHAGPQEVVMPYTCLKWRPPISGAVDPASSSSAVLVTTQSQGVIQHWHVASGKCTHTLKDEVDNDLYTIDFSTDGRVFATAGQDTRVYIYDEMTKQRVCVMADGPGHHRGHANRVFSVKFHPSDPNILLSSGWDRTIQIYDMRAGAIVDSIFGPEVSGDSLDVHEDLILAGSNRNKDVLQLFSMSKRALIQTIDWEASSKKDLETGFVYGAKFSKPDPHLIFAGGAGRNELKVFENNVDGSGTMRILASINEFDSACLSLDTSKNGESFAFGLQNGRIFVVSYKIDEMIGDFEGYGGQYSLEGGKEFLEAKEAVQQTQHLVAPHGGAAGHVGGLHAPRARSGSNRRASAAEERKE